MGEEVIQAAAKDPAWTPALRSMGRRGRPHLDLQGFLRRQAQDLGLDPTKEGSIDRCTVCETDLLWSYRRTTTTTTCGAGSRSSERYQFPALISPTPTRARTRPARRAGGMRCFRTTRASSTVGAG